MLCFAKITIKKEELLNIEKLFFHFMRMI